MLPCLFLRHTILPEEDIVLKGGELRPFGDIDLEAGAENHRIEAFFSTIRDHFNSIAIRDDVAPSLAENNRELLVRLASQHRLVRRWRIEACRV